MGQKQFSQDQMIYTIIQLLMLNNFCEKGYSSKFVVIDSVNRKKQLSHTTRKIYELL